MTFEEFTQKPEWKGKFFTADERKCFEAGKESAMREMLEYLNENKKAHKALAEDYSERLKRKTASDEVCRNMFYHHLIAYNDYEDILAHFEERNPVMLCFGEPPELGKETLETQIKEIAG